MILVLKKFCSILFVCLLLAINVSAEEFLVYGKQNSALAKTLGMSETELKDYCKSSGITYLAANADNTKQVRKTEIQDAFSKQIVDFAVLKDKEILDLTTELTGFSDAKGEVVVKNSYKFLKIEMETEDSGGKYILTQYITVKKSTKQVLTFYTAVDADRGYIDEIFEQQFKKEFDYKPFVIIGVILLGLAIVVISVLIFKDLNKNKEE